MYRVLLMTCALGLVAGFDMGPNKWARSYIRTKILEDCFGKDVMEEWTMKFGAAGAKCLGQDVKLSTIMDALKNRYQRMQQPMIVPVSMAMPQFLSSNMAPGMSNRQTQFRRKRQASFTSEMVMGIREKAIGSLESLSCIMKELNFVNEDLTPNVDYMKRITRDLIPDQDLRDDMDDAIDMCSSFSKCMPLERSSNPVVREYGRVLGFLKCDNTQKLMICMKHNMRKEMSQSAMMAGVPMPDAGSSAVGAEDPMDAIFELMMIGSDPALDVA